MERLTKFYEWLKSISPPWLRAVVLAILAVLVFISTTSCGTTRAVARITDNGSSTITITTNNPTSVNASPNVSLEYKRDVD